MNRIWIIMISSGIWVVTSLPAASQNPNKKQIADIASIKQVMADLDVAYDKRDALFTGLYKKEKGQWRASAIRLMIPPAAQIK